MRFLIQSFSHHIVASTPQRPSSHDAIARPVRGVSAHGHQSATNARCLTFDPASRFVFTCQGDAILAYRFDAAKGALALRRVVRAGGQDVEAATEAIEDLLGCEHLDASGRKLEREREAVEPLGDLTHRGVGLEAGLQLARALRE